MRVIVLGVQAFTTKDGRRIGRVTLASTPRNQNARGLSASEVDAIPEVVDSMTVFPAVYDLQVDMQVANGFGGRANEVRPVVSGAVPVAPLVAAKEAASGAKS